MTDLIVVAILVVIIGAAARYVYKAKKNGVKCIGCPAGQCGCCSQKQAEGSGCGCADGSCCCHTDKK